MAVAVGGPKTVTDYIKANGGIVGPRSYWAGAWMLKPTVGYGGLDRFYAECKADGIQPLVLVWPIGDDDGVKFLTTGVQDMYQNVWKTRQDGLNMAREVARRARAAGASPIIVLNNEFNKGALQKSPDFAKFYDDQVAIIRAECPTAKIVFPPGAWGDLAALFAYYKPQVDKSDMVGLQCGYFKPRRTDDMALLGKVMADNFAKLPGGKPRILYDVFLSTYGGNHRPEPPFKPVGWKEPVAGETADQAMARNTENRRLADICGQALEAQQAAAIRGLGSIPNLVSIVYRDLRDNPGFDIANYGGMAERYVGVMRTSGVKKPALDALLGISRPVAAPAPTPVPPPPPKTRTEEEYAAVVAQKTAAEAKVAGLTQELNVLMSRVIAARAALDGP